MRGTARRAAGFTLIEVLAVLFLTALVVGVALDFYVDLSNQSAHAAEVTRDIRRATSLMDRIARDLERAMMVVKPAWRFVHHFFIRLGFLDGKKGLTISYLNALSVLERYRELKRLEVKNKITSYLVMP